MRRALLLAATALAAAACAGDGVDLVGKFTVEGAGMEPTLQDGVEVEVVKYGPDRPQRGDVILFHSPVNPDRIFFKRIIGTPGENVVIVPDTGEVLVDGRLLDEPYTRGTTGCGQVCRWSVPPDHFFVLGDNRPNSADSRQGWFVPSESILGWVKIEP